MQSFLKCISLTLVILFSAFSGCFGSNTTNQIVEQRGVHWRIAKSLFTRRQIHINGYRD